MERPVTTQYIIDQQLSVAKRKSRTFTMDDLPLTTKKFVRNSEWTDKETLGLLDVARKMNIQSSLDSKQKCPLTMCEIIETRLESRNIFKTDLQIKRKLKDLRDIYNICRRQHAIYGNDKPQEVQFFNYLESIFGSATAAPHTTNPTPSTSGEFEFVDVGDFAIKTVTPAFLEEEDANEAGAAASIKDVDGLTERETKLLQNFAETVKENQEMRLSKFMEEQKQFLADELATRRAWEENVIKNCNYAIINNFAGLLKANQDDLVNKVTEAQQKLYVEEMNKQIRWDVHLLKFHLKKQKEEMDRVLSAVQAANGDGSGSSGGSINVPRNEVLVKEERMAFPSAFPESLGFDFS